MHIVCTWWEYLKNFSLDNQKTKLKIGLKIQQRKISKLEFSQKNQEKNIIVIWIWIKNWIWTQKRKNFSKWKWFQT